MSLTIYTYSNPYELRNEPYWDSIRMCAHFCVSQTMVNGLREVYKELDQGQVTTVEELIGVLYPTWFDTKTYVEQYALLTNALDSVKPNISVEKWSKEKQALRFNKSGLLDSIRLLCEMGIDYTNLKIKNISEEQLYLVATYKKVRELDSKKRFEMKRRFSEKEICDAVKEALVARDKRRGRIPKSVQHVDCETVIFHGIHQFTPAVLHAIEEISRHKRVVLLFNYQEQYKEIYQTWVDVYSCFDINIKSQFNNEFKPTRLLQASYRGNLLGDTLAKLACGKYVGKAPELDSVSVLKFDNITEFSGYVAKIYEEAKQKFEKNRGSKERSALSCMKEQFYAANNEVNDILKVYFPEQFGERHFLAYPIGRFFVAVTNMWDAENGGIHIESLDDIAECLYSGALPERQTGTLITAFYATKNYFSRETDLERIIYLLKELRRQKQKIIEGKTEFAEQLNRLSYYDVSVDSLDELITALTALDAITKLFYEDFEKEENNFKHFYEKVRDFLERQVLPNAETESEFQDILLRLLKRLEEAEEMKETSSFECLKDTMAYYLKQQKQKGDSADWIVRDFQQIDGDILMSSKQDSDIIYHFACVSDQDMNVKKEEQFPWPLNLEFFERACEPLDWKYQVYIKSRREFKHFKRYALIYGLVFNRCNFKLSYVKNYDDRENELYYLLKLLGIDDNIKENEPDTVERQRDFSENFSTGLNQYKFVKGDGFRRRICAYRFGLETMIEGGTRYKDRFLQSKYFEILLANQARRKLVGQIGTEDLINEVLESEMDDLKGYFIFLNESEWTDIKSNVKATLRKILEDGKCKRFPKISSEDAECMDKKEEFIYLHLENEKKVNVLSGKFNELSRAEQRTFMPEYLKKERYCASVDIWCQWCADREICLEYYKSETER